ncbi:hypothetical protein [Asticcacaulis taihuensis]|uniref:hypothetical protein n=1 Tax=Asticcacaulis taihuensis TaxID=260084 RepID=UPI0026EC51BC|nr:hypothetical protein [Asticcacaulis taihuensis]
MIKLTDSHLKTKKPIGTAKKIVRAVIILGLFVITVVFLTNSFDGWHVGNLYAAHESTTSYGISLWSAELGLGSLLIWNWKRIKPVLIQLSALCIFGAFGVSAVVALFPIFIPRFHVPQAIFLALLNGYFMLVASAYIPSGIASSDPRMTGKSDSSVFKALLIRLLLAFGSFSLILLFSLMFYGDGEAAAIAYGFAALIGVVSAWLVRLNIRPLEN